MRDPNVYSEKLGQIVYRFNIGSHWTTLIGMAGVAPFLAGTAGLMGLERYVLGITALTLTAVNLCSWSFFVSMSGDYFQLVLGVDREIMFIYYAMKWLSLIFAVILLVVMLMNKKKKNNFLTYRILSCLVLILSAACLLFITICNHWYLLQAVLAAVVVALLSGGRMHYRYIKEEKGKVGRQENGE